MTKNATPAALIKQLGYHHPHILQLFDLPIPLNSQPKYAAQDESRLLVKLSEAARFGDWLRNAGSASVGERMREVGWEFMRVVRDY